MEDIRKESSDSDTQQARRRRRVKSERYEGSVAARRQSRRSASHHDDGGQQHDNFDEYFAWVNERRVNDIVLDLFYKPHTLTLLGAILALLGYLAFTNDDSSTEQNLWLGAKTMLFIFLTISVLIFPNGPFTRPHPAVWRIVFGMSIAYLMLLIFVLFQSYNDVKSMLRWLDPDNLNRTHLEEKEYAQNCSDLSLARIWESTDIFVFAHFWGWGMKALLLRHTIILWYISISWELTEIFFSHLLPNFLECWWDALIMDVLLANGLGIALGMYIAKRLEMRQYHWESIRHISGARAKIKRAVMQFTPESWMQVQWLDGHSTTGRAILILVLVLVWTVMELNTFFLKHIFAVDTHHPLVAARILLIGLMGAPTIRQYYLYVTDPRAYRVGTQCWVYVVITLTEALICVKNGKKLFATTQIAMILGWLAMLCVGAILCVYVSVLWARRSDYTVKRSTGGTDHYEYLDSSTENLTELYKRQR